jgi:hypothetical protein
VATCRIRGATARTALPVSSTARTTTAGWGWVREDEWYPFCTPRAGIVSVQDDEDLTEKVA